MEKARKGQVSIPSIFEFGDYRAFLRDYYEKQRKSEPKFSHRYFAQRAGLKSSGFFSDVLTGKRNLTEDLILKFAKALKLKGEEMNYFDELVHLNQAKTTETRKYHYERMLKLKKVKIDILGKNQYEFYSRWYYSVIREILTIFPFKDDYKALAAKLDPPLKPAQAKQAIKILERFKLIKRDKDGYYRQTSNLISTGDQFQALSVANFHIAMTELAKEAIDRHSRERRDMSTLTLTLSEESFRKAKDEIDMLRKRLLSIAQDDAAVDRVYQVNLQVFPLSKF